MEVDRLRVERVLAQARLGELDGVLVARRQGAVDEILAAPSAWIIYFAKC